MSAGSFDAQRPARSVGTHTVRASVPDLLPRARRPVRSNDDRQRDYFEAFRDCAPVESPAPVEPARFAAPAPVAPAPVEPAPVEPARFESPAPLARPRTPSNGRLSPVIPPSPTGEHSGGWPVTPMDQPSTPVVSSTPVAPPMPAQTQTAPAVELSEQLRATALDSNPRLRPPAPTQPATAPVTSAPALAAPATPAPVQAPAAATPTVDAPSAPLLQPPAGLDIDPMSLTTEMEPIDDEVMRRRKVDQTLARFSAVHDEIVEEERKRKRRGLSRFMPWHAKDMELDDALTMASMANSTANHDDASGVELPNATDAINTADDESDTRGRFGRFTARRRPIG